MPAGAVDLDELVRRLAARDPGRAEANIQSDVRTLLLYGGLNLSEESVEVVLETAAGGGRRIDVEVGRTVIEVKKNLTSGKVKAEAEAQLAGYVAGRSRTLDERYVGVLTDGADWYLYHLADGPLPSLRVASEYHVRAGDGPAAPLLVWLEGVLATRSDISATPAEVAARLGAGSPSHRLDRVSLSSLYAACRDQPRVALKRELWARLLQTAYGLHFADDDELFLGHTYLVVTAEVIAHAVIGFPIATLRADELVGGRRFEDAGIGGVVESDFFDWVLDAPGGRAFIETLARRLSRFRWEAVEHDVLKALYESVISAEQRKELGEYYTPDWLAERIVEQVVTDPAEQRVLDPSCGSGTFLFHAVRRYLAAAEQAGTPAHDAIAGVVTHVTGVDIHPVAVTLARVTYLLAIGTDRLRSARQRTGFSVPVYLGDSLQWQQGTDLLTASGDVVIATTDGAELFARQLTFPARVVDDAATFDGLVAEMAEKSRARPTRGTVPSLSGVFRRAGVHPDDEPVLEATFRALCELHDEGRDHIWGYYARNLARPRWLANKENRVDVLVGNPPWLAYRYMPAGLQSEFKARSQSRGMWAGSDVANIQDLSGYFVARSCELYLKAGGAFGFVMPAAVMSRKQYAGFRTGNFDTETGLLRLAFGQPWDFSDVESTPAVFPVPCSVVFGTRRAAGEEAEPLPSATTRWTGSLPVRDTSWNQAAPHLSSDSGEVAVRDASSAYRSRFTNGATLYPRVLLIVEEVEAGPLGMVGGVRRVRSLRSKHAPWKDVPPLEGSVEEQFVRDVFFGSNVVPFRCLPPSQAVIPLYRDRLLEEDDPDLDHFPGLAAWWRRAEHEWRERRSKKVSLSLTEQIDYRRKLAAQVPVVPRRFVYSLSGSNLAAARLSAGSALVDQSLLWAAASTDDEGLYLAAVFNSETFGNEVAPYQSKGQFGRRHFTKDVFSVPFPMYDPANELHQQLAAAATRAEQVAEQVDLATGVYFPTARRHVREALRDDGVTQVIDGLVAELLVGGTSRATAPDAV